MPVFDPAQPAADSELKSAPVRENFIALKALIDAIPPAQKGDKGDQGDPGQDGSPGPQGPAGTITWGFTWMGAWQNQGYVGGNVVSYQGQLYVCFDMPLNSDPPAGNTEWHLLSIAGPAGQDGVNGQDGAPGPQGPAGEVSSSDLNNALAKTLATTSANSNGVAPLAAAPNDPPTAADWQVLADKMNELIVALRR